MFDNIIVGYSRYSAIFIFTELNCKKKFLSKDLIIRYS